MLKMRYRARSLFLVVLVFVLVATGILAEMSVSEADELILTKDVANIKKAIEALEKIIAEDPKNAEAHITIAKAHLYLGDRVQESKLEIFEAGKSYAEKATELDPKSPDAYYWLAALTGRVGQTRGILQSLFMINPMKEALDTAIEIDPNYAAAYYVLSLLYTEAPGWPVSIGNKQKALEYAQKAVDLAPDDIEFNVHLAKALINNKRTKEAVAVLNRVLEMPHIDTELEYKEEARELLQKHK